MNTKLINGRNCVSRDVVYSDFSKPTPKDVVYSWDDNEVKQETKLSSRAESLESMYSESRDTEYSASLSMRLIMLKRPLYIQLVYLHKDHARVYRGKNNLKPLDIEILMEDFRYELHRIMAKAKDMVIEGGGNLDTILRLSSFNGGPELQKASRSLTVLFKRIEQAYTTFGYIPREYQQKLNDNLSVLISHFVLDIYGPELEKRKTEVSVFSRSDAKV